MYIVGKLFGDTTIPWGNLTIEAFIESLLTAQTTEFVDLLRDFLAGIERGEARQLIEQALQYYTNQPQ